MASAAWGKATHKLDVYLAVVGNHIVSPSPTLSTARGCAASSSRTPAGKSVFEPNSTLDLELVALGGAWLTAELTINLRTFRKNSIGLNQSSQPGRRSRF